MEIKYYIWVTNPSGMKRTTILLLFALLFLPLAAQQTRQKKVTLFELDLGAGASYWNSSALRYGSSFEGRPITQCSRFLYEFELRVNLPGRPWSIGIQNTQARVHFENSELELCEQHEIMGVMLTGDYNLWQGKWFNPFLGGGVGVTYTGFYLVNTYDNVRDIFYTPRRENTSNRPYFALRTGFELFYHVRGTLTYTSAGKGMSYYGFTAGVVFGGGKRIKRSGK